MQTIEADYLVVGAGAMGMAFVDTLVAETDATVALVDRNDQPGGHWLNAYPFVRLHQPSAFYGVNSRRLGSDTIDAAGWNQGFYELASGAEVCAYYEAVLRQHLLPSGRVSYFPMSEHLGDNRFRTLAGDEHRVEVRRRVVDATYLGVVAPSMRPPPYHVATGVDCVAPNALPTKPFRDQYVIIGGGKTSMDSCLWLLRHGIAPERITWVKPRDSWLLDRAAVQPGRAFARRVLADLSAQWRAIRAADDVDDLFTRLGERGCLLRIDETVRPTMYRCAIVSRDELAKLRLIGDVVRMGRVQALEPGRIVLDGGIRDTDPGALYVDCTGDGIGTRESTPVFAGDHITLQSLRTCQPTFSAAFTAHVEAMGLDDDTRNDYCRPVPHPTRPLDWATMTLQSNRNQLRWFDDPELMTWLSGARLNAASHMGAGADDARDALLQIAPRLVEANAKLEALLRV
ncbi:NAD(P)-binding protein [Mycolicibacterium sp. 050158]|uniref:NAD(P)-binding protein n=1 Tax=Mycolicibacterium sp. 050158 TaxID=3090602 RepID=UPI00299ED3F4|nr:NAD(P)-binding protein [Mycolicibacterium sp. 050158]MDX1890202.1 NAD(P)-binding protein [Mycolicibacterium sp. 050158]